MKANKMLVFVLAAIVVLVSQSFAANLASDKSSNYSGTWTNGSNGGTGFGLWTLSASGGGGSYIGGTGEAPSGSSFGIYGATSGTSTAFRAFIGSLTAGQTFSIDLGNTTITASGASMGLTLFSGATPEFTLQFTGGGADWQLNDGGSFFNTSQGYVANTPLLFTFTYNGGSSYSYTFGSATGVNFTASNPISGLNGVNLYNNAQGSGQNLGFDNLAIVPEPSTLALVGISLFGAIGLIRRRKV